MSDEVVSLADFRKKTEEEKTPEEQAASETFEEIMKRNEENKERMRKERLNANKSVLRNYRIKPSKS